MKRTIFSLLLSPLFWALILAGTFIIFVTYLGPILLPPFKTNKCYLGGFFCVDNTFLYPTPKPNL